MTHGKLHTLLVGACVGVLFGSLVVGCGDDDGGTNENHHFDDAGQDASAEGDAEVEVDSTVEEIDAAVGGELGIGEACSELEQCDPPEGLVPECVKEVGEEIYAMQFPGGYCSSRCTIGDPDPCEPDGICVSLMMQRYCLKKCDVNSDCREDEGYVCDDPTGEASFTVCIPGEGN